MFNAVISRSFSPAFCEKNFMASFLILDTLILDTIVISSLFSKYSIDVVKTSYACCVFWKFCVSDGVRVIIFLIVFGINTENAASILIFNND